MNDAAMNREIKFRVWDSDINKFRYFGLDCPDLFWFSQNISNFEENIQQFTGLKDKNGREIYEGDIVVAISSDNKYLSVVKWVNDSGQWGFEAIVNEKMPYNYCLSFRCSGWEVIGNIFENTELSKTS